MASDVVKERGLVGSSLATVLDVDGRSLKFDIREDEAQNEKFDETIELLLAAGYFRARIKGVSAFDKVVGGMVWCMSFCDYDIDVDLLFQENLSIGQKIALTEKIVKVLNKMKCPGLVEPHQIQGLDFIHIFPVIQWLVKEAISSREKSGDFIQSFAEYQLDKDHKSSVLGSVVQKKDEPVVVSSFYMPERIYRRNDDSFSGEEEASRVQSTILEYEGSISTDEPLQSSRDVKKGVLIDNTKSSIAGLSKIDESTTLLDTTVIQAAIQEANVEKLPADFNIDKMAVLKPEIRGRIENEEISLEELKERKVYLEQLKNELINEAEKSKSRVNNAKLEFEQIKSLEQDWKTKTAILDELENSPDKKQLDLLKTLLEKHDEVKKAEHEFKECCKKEAALIEAEIEKFSNRSSESNENQTDHSDLKLKHENLLKEMAELRLKLAATNRQTAALQRKLDDAPSRLELNQYQRRFLELYNQIASTQKETKKYYILYNTLHDIRTFMEKEINLLNSVYDNYENGLYSDQMKSQFVRQLEQTFDGIRQTKSRSEKKMAEEKLKRDTLRENYQELLDRQRLYYKVVADFQEECRKNEVLHARLDKMSNQM